MRGLSRCRMLSDRYHYQVLWARGEYVATCLEFPGLSYLAPDSLTSLLAIRQLVTDTVIDMEARGETAPEPWTGDCEYGEDK